ncbi:putative PurR-regulated permease PerM [Anaerobacterium chartisolvens]|uniref:Putative PurR-regulated permease PerM n=1 Tax=Anaerobacterium chartisolvens TaxID=1297424 RepID=A0A369B6T1_9FIRM|nr:AI-2E family transporter [Anaerobacterium chartisolvens]RCX17141.1 putative PurR-regulated permease PerM [Anaerobacterium chartisolvens]
MDLIKALLQKDLVRRVLIFSFIGFMLFLIKDMLNLMLLTFIFTYLMYRLQNFLILRLKRFVYIKQKIIVVLLYLIFACITALALFKYVPVLIQQIKDAVDQLVAFYQRPHENPFEKYLITLINQADIASYFNKGADFLFKSAFNISKWGINILISVILSLFFLLERNRILRFTQRFKTSKISVFYNEICFFGNKFLNSFGKVIEAQILIALINCILSVIALWIMGFPQILALGIMIFVLGLIPVAGVIISLIPLCLIAYNIGASPSDGIKNIVYVLIMIALLHALESYFLNPKLMSSKTELPVFYTFLVLIFSEHFFGVWGLIIGLPVFIFVLDLIEVNRDSDPLTVDKEAGL